MVSVLKEIDSSDALMTKLAPLLRMTRYLRLRLNILDRKLIISSWELNDAHDQQPRRRTIWSKTIRLHPMSSYRSANTIIVHLRQPSQWRALVKLDAVGWLHRGMKSAHQQPSSHTIMDETDPWGQIRIKLNFKFGSSRDRNWLSWLGIVEVTDCYHWNHVVHCADSMGLKW